MDEKWKYSWVNLIYLLQCVYVHVYMSHTFQVFLETCQNRSSCVISDAVSDFIDVTSQNVWYEKKIYTGLMLERQLNKSYIVD